MTPPLLGGYPTPPPLLWGCVMLPPFLRDHLVLDLVGEQFDTKSAQTRSCNSTSGVVCFTMACLCSSEPCRAASAAPPCPTVAPPDHHTSYIVRGKVTDGMPNNKIYGLLVCYKVIRSTRFTWLLRLSSRYLTFQAVEAPCSAWASFLVGSKHPILIGLGAQCTNIPPLSLASRLISVTRGCFTGPTGRLEATKATSNAMSTSTRVHIHAMHPAPLVASRIVTC
jgi:hypothetical protein